MPASAIGIILDPSEVATSRTELNLNSGAYRIASEGPNWGDAAIAAAIADRKFGSVPVGYRIPNRIVSIPLIVKAVSGTTFNQAQTKLQQKVARFQDEGGWLKRTSSDGTTKLYADIVDATLTFPDPRFQDVEGGVVLTLECLPDFYGDEVAGTGTRRNLCPNPSAEVDTSLWGTSVQGTLIEFSRSLDYAKMGTASFEFRASATGNSQYALIHTSPPGSTIPVTTGLTYTFSVYVQALAFGASGGPRAFIDWYTSGGVYISSSTPSAAAPSAGGSGLFTRLFTTVVAPANAAFAALYVGHYGAAGNALDNGEVAVFYADGFLFEQQASAGDYFDGSGVNASGTWVADGTTRWTGTAHASTSVIGTGPSGGDHDSLIFSENDIPGDYSARSRYTFTDTGSQARQAVLVASQSRTYDSAATAALSYEAEDLTPLDLAAVVTQPGAHGGASNNAVEHTGIGPQWTPILSTEHDTLGNLTHTGNFRLFARVYASSDALLRLEYAIGDATMRRANASVSINGGDAFYIADLGEVRIDSDAGQWIGAIYAYSETTANTVGVDKLWLAPTESLSIVKARRELSGNVEVGLDGYDGKDSFNQTAGNLGGKTADVGGNWTTAGGDATDFTVNATDHQLNRTEVSDASVDAGRFAVLGAAGTNTGVYVETAFTSAAANGFLGVLARYTDASNYLAAGIYLDGLGAGFVYAWKEVSTSISELAAGVSFPVYANQGRSIKLLVSADGTFRIYLGGILVHTGQHAHLATGGALASGKAGIYDANMSATANTRVYDNFLAWTPDSDAACISGGDLSAKWDGAWRETATSGIYAPAHVEGSHPRAPASGLEARTCRTLILPSAGDFDTIPDADPTAFTVASHHRPCYLFAPSED